MHKKAIISLNLTQLKTWSWSGRIARRRTDIATATSLEDPTHASVERDFDWCLRALCHRRRTVEPLIQISALNPMIAGDSVFGHPCVNTSQGPVLGRSERIRRVSKPHVAHQPWCMAGRRSRAQLCWARRSKYTCETTSLLPSRRKARVTNATFATDTSVSGPLCLMPGNAHWTWFFPRSAPHAVESTKTNRPEHRTPSVSS